MNVLEGNKLDLYIHVAILMKASKTECEQLPYNHFYEPK